MILHLILFHIFHIHGKSGTADALLVFNRDYYLLFIVMILILHFPLIITTLFLFKGEEAFMAESQTFYLSYASAMEVLQNRGNGKIYV